MFHIVSHMMLRKIEAVQVFTELKPDLVVYCPHLSAAVRLVSWRFAGAQLCPRFLGQSTQLFFGPQFSVDC